MIAGQIWELIGCFLAAAGVGYVWLGLLWATRAYKHWPRTSVWSAAAVTLLIGLGAAATSGELVLYGAAAILACAFVVWRGRHVLFPKAAPVRLAGAKEGGGL